MSILSEDVTKALNDSKTTLSSSGAAAAAASKADPRLLSSREESVLMRTLVGYGGYVLPCLHLPPTVRDQHLASLVPLPPNDALYLRVNVDRRAHLFTDSALLQLWIQSPSNRCAIFVFAGCVRHDRACSRMFADLLAKGSFIPEFSPGLRTFDALLRRLDIVQSVSIDGEHVLTGDTLTNTMSVVLRRVRIERAASVLAATAGGVSDAAVRYRDKTLKAFREHDAFFVSNADASDVSMTKETGICAFTDEHLLLDSAAHRGASDAAYTICDGAELVDRAVQQRVPLTLNYATALEVKLPLHTM
jgi:hypothetical protein